VAIGISQDYLKGVMDFNNMWAATSDPADRDKIYVCKSMPADIYVRLL